MKILGSYDIPLFLNFENTIEDIANFFDKYSYDEVLITSVVDTGIGIDADDK